MLQRTNRRLRRPSNSDSERIAQPQREWARTFSCDRIEGMGLLGSALGGSRRSNLLPSVRRYDDGAVRERLEQQQASFIRRVRENEWCREIAMSHHAGAGT